LSSEAAPATIATIVTTRSISWLRLMLRPVP
jgi:hypothetical protein